MAHPSHELKAYTADVQKRLVFCVKCGKEEDEGLNEPCSGKIYVAPVDKGKEPK